MNHIKLSELDAAEVLIFVACIWFFLLMAVYVTVALTTGCWMIWPANQWFFCAVGF